MIEQVLPAALNEWFDRSKAAPHVVLDVREPWEVQTASVKPKGFTPALLAGIDRGMTVRPEQRPQSIAEWRAMLFPAAAWQQLERIRPDWRYVSMPDIGHVPQLEAPAEFAEHMLRWLAEQR